MPPRLLCLLALLPTLHGLRAVVKTRAFQLDFFACEGEVGEANALNCSSSPGVPSRQMDGLLAAGYRRMREVAGTGREALAVQVGADGLRNPARWTDIHLWRKVEDASGLHHGQLRAAFAEPIADKAQDFYTNVRRVPMLVGQNYLATAMVDGSCTSPTRTLYRVAPRAGMEFGFDIKPTQGWVSTDRGHPVRVVQEWADHGWPMRCFHDDSRDCSENFRRFRNAPNMATYIEELAIRCQTLEGLVREAGAQLSDLSMVVVDAEGTDARILNALAGRDDFRPGFIMWEGSTESKDAALQELVPTLRRKGYKVGITKDSMVVEANGQMSDSGNFVAVLE